jgi:biopolymer transport protein ExbB
MDTLKALIDYGVIGLLLILVVVALSVAAERWLYYRHLDMARFPNRHVFQLALTRRLVIVGTVAANAPYIGLLGTVFGIMLTFQTMGTSGKLAVSSIMVGLSLALKATAIGLLVAIPCVVMNNALHRRVSELMTLYDAEYGAATGSDRRHSG